MPLTRNARILAAALAALAIAGCNRFSASTAPSPGATTTIIDQLNFGRNIPTGGTVSDSAWLVFLDQVVTPRFPDGFGYYRTTGQWRYADGRIEREEGFSLQLFHPIGSPPDSTIEAIAREYIKRFNQEAVARNRIPVQSWMYWGVKPH